MSSGVVPDEACKPLFEELKLGKKLRFVIYKVSDDRTSIIPDTSAPTTGDAEDDYENFLKCLTEAEPRYAVYDFEYQSPDGGKRNKIVFYSWTPDGAGIRKKMLYSSSKDSLRQSLVGIGADIQGTDYDEVSYATVLERVQRGSR